MSWCQSFVQSIIELIWIHVHFNFINYSFSFRKWKYQNVNYLKKTFICSLFLFATPKIVEKPESATNFRMLVTIVTKTSVSAMSRCQWCWWHRYVGDFMMVTDLRCWWQNHYVGDFFRYVGVLNRSPSWWPTFWIGHKQLKLVINTFGLQHPSPTSM